MIVKICKHHGELTIEQITKRKECKLCKKESQKTYNNKNRDKNTKRSYQWKKDNKEKHRLAHIKHERKRCLSKVKELTDFYVKDLMVKQYKIQSKDVEPWMIAIKREIVKLRRKIREKHDSKNL